MQLLSPASKSADTGQPAASAEHCARDVLDSVPPVMWFIRRQMRGHRGGLSVPQFRTLVRVNREPGSTVSQVAEHLGASLPTASRIVTILVDRGLLAREVSPSDRRAVVLRLTVRGRAVLAEAERGTHDAMESELAELPADEQRQIIQAMAILRGLFGDANGIAKQRGANAAAQPMRPIDAGAGDSGPSPKNGCGLSPSASRRLRRA
jgi:DNA-binding MarR family transcriptional regulator